MPQTHLERHQSSTAVATILPREDWLKGAGLDTGDR